MIEGLGPYLGENILGTFITAEDKSDWFYQDGAACVVDDRLCAVARPATLVYSKRPIAALLSRHTASSGTVMLISFIGDSRVDFQRILNGSLHWQCGIHANG